MKAHRRRVVSADDVERRRTRSERNEKQRKVRGKKSDKAEALAPHTVSQMVKWAQFDDLYLTQAATGLRWAPASLAHSHLR